MTRLAAADPPRQQDRGRVRRPVVLSIAGFDPSSGAGVTADLKVFAAHGVFGMACITALTVQSTLGVKAVEPVPAATVAATLAALAEDVSFAGIKVGMLATDAILGIIDIFLHALHGVPVVLDPVLRSSSGRELLEAGGVESLRRNLLGKVDWITPNRQELAVLTGMPVGRREEILEAAGKLQRMAREVGNDRLNLVVTGGDMDPPEDLLFTNRGELHSLVGERVETKATHGTGCAFSSALLCRVVAGDSPLAAATAAKQYVTRALQAAYPVGKGKGPMHHLFALDKEFGKELGKKFDEKPDGANDREEE
jgi:hydroxymethylpyrimidine/phosphomethylpyrimidine kinase